MRAGDFSFTFRANIRQENACPHLWTVTRMLKSNSSRLPVTIKPVSRGSVKCLNV